MWNKCIWLNKNKIWTIIKISTQWYSNSLFIQLKEHKYLNLDSSIFKLVSSNNSLFAHSSNDSPYSNFPPGRPKHFSLIRFPIKNLFVLELKLAAYIQDAIPKLSNIKVFLLSQTQTRLSFQVNFSFYDGIKFQNNLSCFIEVPI